MAERDAELFQIGLGQVRQDVGVNGTFAERLLVALQTKLSQPSRDIHAVPRAMVDCVERYQNNGSVAIDPFTASSRSQAAMSTSVPVFLDAFSLSTVTAALGLGRVKTFGRKR